jgi:hypothetical protein
MQRLPIRTQLIVACEIAAGLAAAVLIALWAREPSGPYEAYLAVAGIVFALTEAYRRYEGRLFKTEGVERTPSERVRHHEALRAQFRAELESRGIGARSDVIIRHVNRLDDYPNNKDRPGISPWFKVGLLATYHRGIVVGLGWYGMLNTPEGPRRADYSNGEQSEYNAMLTGEIPYDSIESLNERGDEYYYLPHIFCHFAHRGQPYERLFYTVKEDMGSGHFYWREVASFDEVNSRSKD